MAAFNYFGATVEAVVLKFATGGYAAESADFGGDPAVLDALADATNQLAQALPLAHLDALQRPELCQIENRGADGQTIVAFPAVLLPAFAGRVHVWRGMPSQFVSRPMLQTSPWISGAFGGYAGLSSPVPPGAAVELPESAYTVTPTGIILGTPLARNEQVFASWDVATTDAAYSVPSLADWVANGAAAMLGPKVYTTATAQWEYVSGMVTGWNDLLEAVHKGTVTPADLRVLRWWKAPENAQENTVDSVRKYRT
jgi:hypothetical protein